MEGGQIILVSKHMFEVKLDGDFALEDPNGAEEIGVGVRQGDLLPVPVAMSNTAECDAPLSNLVERTERPDAQ